MRLFIRVLAALTGFVLLANTALLVKVRAASPSLTLAYSLNNQRCYVSLSGDAHTCTPFAPHEHLSPDGKWQALLERTYSRETFFSFRLVKLSTGNGEQQPLFSNFRPMNDFSWSPDGKLISFTTEDRLGRTGIYIVTAQGNTFFTRLGPGVETSPVWSPDGKWLAFAFRSGAPVKDNIYIMRPDGMERQQLTFNDGADYAPAWSPDGQWIAFVSNRDNDAEIYKIRTDGSAEQRLTAQRGADVAPSWSPDGEWIAFLSTRGNQQSIYRMRSDGSDVRRLQTVPHHVRRVEWGISSKNLNFLIFLPGLSGVFFYGLFRLRRFRLDL